MGKIPIGIVDDEELIVNLLRNYFRDSDKYLVSVTALSGQSFTKKLKSTSIDCRPEIVITDLRMKDMDGIQTTCEIRKIAPSTKIVTMRPLHINYFMCKGLYS